MRVYLKSYSSAKCLTGSEECGSQYFYHSDHLGSAQLVTNHKGEVYQRIEYTPYGETWIDMQTNTTALYDVPYRFTAKELDKETGLYYYGARYLDPKYSRWISADPALGEYIPAAGKANLTDMANLPGMGGIFNHTNAGLFHYAGNNPVRYIDPDGRKISIVAPSLGDKEYVKKIRNLIKQASKSSPEFAMAYKAIKDNPNITVMIQMTKKPGESAKTECCDTKAKMEHRPSNSIIYIDPDAIVISKKTGLVSPPVAGIAHEMQHAYDNMLGIYDESQDVWEEHGGEKIFIYNKLSESRAIDLENSVRVRLKLPYRDSYDGYEVNIKPENTFK